MTNENTIIIPILNIYGTGGRLQERLPDFKKYGVDMPEYQKAARKYGFEA